jgi:hypothetical protein
MAIVKQPSNVHLKMDEPAIRSPTKDGVIGTIPNVLGEYPAA